MDAYLQMPTNESFLPRERKAYYFLYRIVNPPARRSDSLGLLY